MTAEQLNFPDNPILKYFHPEKHVASAGPEMIWKIFTARRKTTNEPCSIFLFEKSIADKMHKPRRREIVASMLRRDIKLLMRIGHPCILRVIHPAEENGETLAFASEPIIASLANVLGNHIRCPNPIPPEIKQYVLNEFNIKFGIYQLTQVLRFLHTGQSMYHNNICPGSVFLTPNDEWRLGEFSFLTMVNDGSRKVNQERGKTSMFDLGLSPWVRKLPKMARPNSHYAAPECLALVTTPCVGFRSKRVHSGLEANSEERKRCEALSNRQSSLDEMTLGDECSKNCPGTWSDMFAFGLLICALYDAAKPSNFSIQSKQKLNSLQTLDKMDRETVEPTTNCELAKIQNTCRMAKDPSLPDAFRKAVEKMPPELVEPVEKMLSIEPTKRPTSQLFSLLKYFDDPSIICLDGVLLLTRKSDEDKIKILNLLHRSVEDIPQALLYSKIVPRLVDSLTETETTALVKGSPVKRDTRSSNRLVAGTIIRVMANIVQKASPKCYEDYLSEHVRKMLSSCRHVQTAAEVLNNATSYTKHASPESVEQLLVPMVIKCLRATDKNVKIAAMSSLRELSGYFQQSELDEIVLPNLMKSYEMVPKMTQINATVLSSLDFLVKQVSITSIHKQVVPFLLDIGKLFDEDLDHRDYHKSSSGVDTRYPMTTICGVWKTLINQRGASIEPQVITKEIFPSILPHVLNRHLKLDEFRVIISTLYALLDVLDVSGGSETNLDATQYRLIPAVTIDTPAGAEKQIGSLNGDGMTDATVLRRGSNASMSGAETTTPFVPMLHPKQIRELELSPNLPRRSSAHVIFPIPSTSAQRTISPDAVPITEKSTNNVRFGLTLPNVNTIRRHSYDILKQVGSVQQNSLINSKLSSHSGHRSPSYSLTEGELRFNRSTDRLDGFGSRRLLTAQICDGPFVSSRSTGRIPSASNLLKINGKFGSSKQLLLSETGISSDNRRSSFNVLSDTVRGFLGHALHR